MIGIYVGLFILIVTLAALAAWRRVVNKNRARALASKQAEEKKVADLIDHLNGLLDAALRGDAGSQDRLITGRADKLDWTAFAKQHAPGLVKKIGQALEMRVERLGVERFRQMHKEYLSAQDQSSQLICLHDLKTRFLGYQYEVTKVTKVIGLNLDDVNRLIKEIAEPYYNELRMGADRDRDGLIRFHDTIKKLHAYTYLEGFMRWPADSQWNELVVRHMSNPSVSDFRGEKPYRTDNKGSMARRAGAALVTSQHQVSWQVLVEIRIVLSHCYASSSTRLEVGELLVTKLIIRAEELQDELDRILDTI